MKPIIFDSSQENLESFKNRNIIVKTVDIYKEQLEELFLIRNPRFRFDKNYQVEFEQFSKAHCGEKSLDQVGNWFYFPWNNFLVHYLPDEMHQELRTARNKNLITREEQEKFYNFKIGIAGLSVGSHPALTLAMMGAGKLMKLADPDEISGSNLNRIRTDFTEVGMNKCDSIVHKIYQLNPYVNIYDYRNGVSPENIGEFLDGIDVLVEELDNLEMKIRLRLEARKRGIPVIMATDNGDNIIVDIERYDLEPNLKLFNGVAGDLSLEEFQKILPQEMPKLATKIAGPKVVVPRMLDSLLEVGKTLYSWPQLGSAATLSGVAIAYIIKRMAFGEKVKTGKLEVNLDLIFDPDYDLAESVKYRDDKRQDFAQKIGL